MHTERATENGNSLQAGQKGNDPKDLTDVIELATEDIDTDKVSVGDLVDSVSQTSLLPLILLPAVALATPLSGIPLFSTAMGIIIFLVSGQMLLQRSEAWLPIKVLDLRTKSARVQAALRKAKPVARWLDRRAHPRLTVLTERPCVLVPQVLCLLSGLILPILESVAFSSSLVGVSVGLLAFGMLRRDGVILLIAIIPYAALGYLINRAVG